MEGLLGTYSTNTGDVDAEADIDGKNKTKEAWEELGEGKRTILASLILELVKHPKQV